MQKDQGRLYYQIELTARQLTLTLVGVAALCVASFVLGYAAAWSVMGDRGGAGERRIGVGPSPTPTALVVAETRVTPSVERTPTATARPRPTRVPTTTPAPAATPTAKPRSTDVAKAPESARDGFWVQVIAVSEPDSLGTVRSRMVELGFPQDHQWLVRTADGSGGTIYKLRVGPLPDRRSADRVARRMKVSGYPGAWVVSP